MTGSGGIRSPKYLLYVAVPASLLPQTSIMTGSIMGQRFVDL